MNAVVEPQRRSAWREPMLWLVAGLPAASVVAGFVLIFAIARHGSTDSLSGSVRRTAQIQAEDTRADEEALRRDLQANLRQEADGVVLDLRGDAGDAGDAPSLRLRLLHPAEAAHDRELALERVAPGRWRASATLDTTHAWNLRVESVDGRWRLAGRLDAGTAGAALEPLWRR